MRNGNRVNISLSNFPLTIFQTVFYGVQRIWNPYAVNKFKLPSNICPAPPLCVFSHAALSIYLCSSVFVIPPQTRAAPGLIIDILKRWILQPCDSEPYLSNATQPCPCLVTPPTYTEIITPDTHEARV